MAETRLLDRVRDALRVRHYSIRTEQSYVQWIKRYILFHGKRHPDDMGAEELAAFLSYLAREKDVAAATQNQALSAILFLYKQVLGRELPWLENVVRAKRPAKLPEVLTVEQVTTVLHLMDGANGLLARLLYGTGMRIMEALRLRVRDLDFDYRQITVRAGKGNKDRVTVLPDALRAPLAAQLERARALHIGDLHDGYGRVWLPHALARKYPNAGREWGWQYVFPSVRRSRDPRDGQIRRHHLDEKNVQRAVRNAARRAGIHKKVTCHTFRDCFATHLLEQGHDIRTVQELLGHKDVRTTMIYTHVLNRGGRGVRSPLDRV
ncbi:MAG: integron integrase [Gammaproteobacteria bacterium]